MVVPLLSLTIIDESKHSFVSPHPVAAAAATATDSRQAARVNHDHAADAAALIRTFADDSIVCFTDGSCLSNPGPCGAGAVICVPVASTPIVGRMALLATTNIDDRAVGEWFEASQSLGQVPFVWQLLQLLYAYHDSLVV